MRPKAADEARAAGGNQGTKATVRIVDETMPGKDFGLIGVAGVRPPGPQNSALDKGDGEHA